jgi:hypothetical protein
MNISVVDRRITTAMHRNDSVCSVGCKGCLRPVIANVKPNMNLIESKL